MLAGWLAGYQEVGCLLGNKRIAGLVGMYASLQAEGHFRLPHLLLLICC